MFCAYHVHEMPHSGLVKNNCVYVCIVCERACACVRVYEFIISDFIQRILYGCCLIMLDR